MEKEKEGRYPNGRARNYMGALCNCLISTKVCAPIFELQNHVHNPKIASTKCNGFAWLLATNKSAFCSSIIFEPFKDRNAFCSGPFGVQNS